MLVASWTYGCQEQLVIRIAGVWPATAEQMFFEAFFSVTRPQMQTKPVMLRATGAMTTGSLVVNDLV
jgi:hypothetical protein